MKRYLISLFLFAVVFPAVGQDFTGDEFRVAFMKNLNTFFNTPPIFDISVHALEDLTATVEYGTPSDSFYQVESLTISAGEVGVVSFDNDEILNQENLNVVENRSFLISTDGEARVYAFHNRLYFAEASPVLPTTALGTDYLIMSYQGQIMSFPSLFNVIGTEDNTVVTVIPAADTPLGAAGDPFTIELDAGEVITVSSSGDLTGSRVTSDGSPISVFGGNQQSFMGPIICGADSHLWEQIMPVEDWATDFAVVPVSGGGGDLTRILAAFDETEVYVGCELLTTLNEGEYFDVFFSEPTRVTSNQPISIAAFTVGADCSDLNTGDPNMRVVLPLVRGNTGIELVANYDLQGGPIVGGGPIHFLHLVMPTADTGALTVNGSPVDVWEPFDIQPELSVAAVSIESLDNLLSVSSEAPFWSEVISMNAYDVFSMSLGSDTLMTIPPVGSGFVSLGPDQILCEGENIVLDPGLGLNGTWQDGSFEETFTVTEPGVYSVMIDEVCGSGFDEVVILEGFTPEVELPDEVLACGQDLTLEVEEEEGVTYLWNTGEEGSSIVVDELGTFVVAAVSDDGCRDTAFVEVIEGATPELSIIGPEAVCADSAATLVATADRPGIFSWSTGETGPVIEFVGPVVLTLEFMPEEGCPLTETIAIDEIGLPFVFSADTAICEGDEVTIVLNAINGTAFWPGISEGPAAVIDASGTYDVIAENQCGTNRFEVVVEAIDCSCPVSVPNVFSPNGDGLNDRFVPKIHCEPTDYELVIRNRWGKMVFSSNDPDRHWNGEYDASTNENASDGVYTYILKFGNPLRPEQKPAERTGTLTLIR